MHDCYHLVLKNMFQDSVKQIIIRLPNWIGDFVMSTPVLSDVRSHFPDACITAMCSSSMADLLIEDPAVDQTLCFTDDHHRRHHLWSIVQTLRAGRYDLGILLTHSFSSAWWFWLGGVKRRVGFSKDGRSILLTDRIQPPENKMHQVFYYKHLLQPLGVPLSETAPRLFVSANDRANDLLEQTGYRPGKPLFGIHAAASYGSAKCWPLDRFHALAQRLLQDDAATVLFFGDAKSSSLVKEICVGLPPRAINWAGATSLRELAYLIRLCDVFITNDSGPMHMAAAVGTPVVALFGSTDEWVTGPWGQTEGVIHKHCDCSPCFQRTCSRDFSCMNRIEVEEVFQKILERKKKRNV